MRIDRDNTSRLAIDVILLGVLLLGVGFRFAWRDWSQGSNLHPDEYGLTNTLTQLSSPTSFEEYFNTRISPLSPYQKYDFAGGATQKGPDNRMRWGLWPITLIRVAAEATERIQYNQIRLIGRTLSAVADTLTLILIYLIGRKLYSHQVGLIAAALSSLAVMQIQQSHFMTVDNFAVAFSTLSVLIAVHILKGRPIQRSSNPANAGLAPGHYAPSRHSWALHVGFGLAFGMAVASRINLLPLASILVVSLFTGIADLKLGSTRDLRQILVSASALLVAAGVVAFITFRVTQPMSFRAPTGNTSVFTFNLNSDWLESMKVASNESSGIGGGPPSEQWAHRATLLFPLSNMILWGMGGALGVTAWLAFAWISWLIVRKRDDWRNHIVPLTWVGGYFAFMGTRWVMSMRYFLPIYPFLCLLAAFLLVRIGQSSGENSRRTSTRENMFGAIIPARARKLIGALPVGLVLLMTAIWSLSFVRAVYMTDHTRIQASRWIFENVPQGSVISNENWDEGLPLPIDGHNPFGEEYKGLVMEVRWPDNSEKREMFLTNLEQVDYIILPSQRGIWSISRIPLTYPMTMEYYRALFDGRLGFELAAEFHSPLKIGPIYVSDVAGAIGVGASPSTPLFNFNPLAAEEAFSIYDHPPVWIFKKRDDFSITDAASVLEAIDLESVVIQSPREATFCKEECGG